MSNTAWKEKWLKALRALLSNYRRQNPDSTESDREVLDGFFEFLVKQGSIKKSPEGKFLVGDLIGDIDELVKKFSSDLN
jgi:hypothetical protein